MRLYKVRYDRWQTKDKEFDVKPTNDRVKGLYPKYYVSKRGEIKGKYASTLKEAEEIINSWIDRTDRRRTDR